MAAENRQVGRHVGGWTAPGTPRRWSTFATRAVLLLAALISAWTLGEPSARGQDATPSAGTTASVPEYRRASKVVVITITGEIDGNSREGSIMAKSVSRRIAMAERAGADALVLDIDTPGGAVPGVLEICNAIKQSRIKNTVAWINPRAYSGGAIIALACREIVVTDPASMGDAMPIAFDPLAGARAIPAELRPKVLTPLISEVLDSTRRHNDFFNDYRRDEYIAQAMVATDLELWRVRNTSTGQEICIDRDEFEMLFPGESTGGPTRLAPVPGVARPTPLPNSPRAPPPSGVPAGSAQLGSVASDAERAQVLRSRRPTLSAADIGNWILIDKVKDASGPAVLSGDDLVHYGFASNDTTSVGGRRALVPITNDAQLRAFFGAKQLKRLNRTWSEGLVLLMTNIVVRALLLVIFLVALFIEISHPGVIVPGVVASLAFVLLVAPPLLIGMANWWEIAAILLGIVLLGLEVFVLPGFGVAGILGIILLFAGLVGTFAGSAGLFPNSDREQTELLRATATVLLSITTAGVAMYFIAKHFGSIPLLNKLVLTNASVNDEDAEDMIGAMDADDGAPARVGEIARAVTPMRPAGRIQIGDRMLDAIAELGYIPAGARVKIVRVSEFRIGVEALPDSPGASAEASG